MNRDDCFVAITFNAMSRELVYSYFYIDRTSNPNTFYYSSQRKPKHIFLGESYFDLFSVAVSNGSGVGYRHLYKGTASDSEDFSALHLLKIDVSGENCTPSCLDGNELLLMKFTDEEKREFQKTVHIDPQQDFYFGTWYTESSGVSRPVAVSIPIFIVKYSKFLERKNNLQMERLLEEILGKNQTLTYQEQVHKFIANYFGKPEEYGDAGKLAWSPFSTYCCTLYSGYIKKLFDMIMREKSFSIFLSISISIFVSSLMSSWNMSIDWLKITFGVLSCCMIGMVAFFAYMNHLSASIKSTFNSNLCVIDKCDSSFKAFWGKFSKKTVQQVALIHIADGADSAERTIMEKENTSKHAEINKVEGICKKLYLGLHAGYVFGSIVVLGMLVLMIYNWLGVVC